MAIHGMQVGSPYYAAPEQERDPRTADGRADVFSVGIMAYRMLTGKLVINTKDSIPPPSTFNPDLNQEWDDFLLRAICINPEKRYQSAHKMRRKLEQTHAHWEGSSKGRCGFMALDQAGPRVKSISLRATPSFIRPKSLHAAYNLDDLMRPKVFPSHRFELKGSELLYCLDTKLLWQSQGAGFTLTWDKAAEYIHYLNENDWQGHNNLRLPTVDELYSMLQPPTLLRDFCFESHFHSSIHWLWSCDSCTKKKAWTVDISESYFEPLDKDGMASVCAVALVG